jgi:hypothetical protein
MSLPGPPAKDIAPAAAGDGIIPFIAVIAGEGLLWILDTRRLTKRFKRGGKKIPGTHRPHHGRMGGKRILQNNVPG